MVELQGPIDVAARRGSRTAELASSPALDAIRRRRASWNLRLAWRVLWRLLAAFAVLVVLEVDLLVEDLVEGGGDELRALDGQERLQAALIA